MSQFRPTSGLPVSNPATPPFKQTAPPEGEHLVGVGLGAVGAGAATGAIGGAVAGPIGAAVGAVVGAVAGGLVGKAAAEVVNPTEESKYWQASHSSRPYFTSDVAYEEYAPAYRYGWESFERRGRHGQTFENIETELANGWNTVKGQSSLAWHQAKAATQDAWDRVARSNPPNRP
jgi:hypothetical protein